MTVLGRHVNTLPMDDFRLDEDAVRSLLARASAAAPESAHALLAAAERGERVGAETIATLWYARAIATDTIADAARAARGARVRKLETFSPLYVRRPCYRLPTLMLSL